MFFMMRGMMGSGRRGDSIALDILKERFARVKLLKLNIKRGAACLKQHRLGAQPRSPIRYSDWPLPWRAAEDRLPLSDG